MEDKDLEVRQKPHYRDPHCQGEVGSLSPEATERALASLLKLLKRKNMSDRQVNKKWMRGPLLTHLHELIFPHFLHVVSIFPSPGQVVAQIPCKA